MKTKNVTYGQGLFLIRYVFDPKILEWFYISIL